ncbi:MAG: hypothetical protein HY541_00335 [Deltaproteobacteria bacterium]|nr:hypothetical protein [Deltaproteobacteria bacterium]
MKRVLFISKSPLCHNLFQAVVTLIPKKAEAVCVESVDEALSLSRRGRPFRLILVDLNALADEKNGAKAAVRLGEHRLLEPAARILLHSRGAALPDQALKEQNFSAFYTKPFLAEELAKIIDDHL